MAPPHPDSEGDPEARHFYLALRLRERLDVRLRLRLRLRLALAVRVRLRLRLALPLAAETGGAYVHASPAVTPRPPAPPSCTKYVRCVTASVIVDASALPPHAAASSLPTRHPNGCAQPGQPVPTYSTVSSAVAPHVVTVSVPPSGVDALIDHAYTSREPGWNVLKPAAQEPDVYMPGVPSASVERGGAEPATPESGRTLASPRQMGGLDVVVGVSDGVRLPDGLAVVERV